jgi:predicted Ser/Thr protein kinase
VIDHGLLSRTFEELCDLPADEQAVRLAELEPDLAAAIRELLDADRATGDLLGEAGGAAFLARELSTEPEPTALGPFRVVGRLGQGAMGVVYLAEQDHPRRLVALKVLHPWMRGPLAERYFRFEAQALGQVQHPGIPAVYQAGMEDGVAFLAMERVDGAPLLAWAGRTRADLDRRLDVVSAIAEAVQAAHDAGLIHRDLKPGNILVDADDQPRLLDFGIATAQEDARVVGTPAYMSPEQAAGRPVDERTDQYALAALTYELLTGRLPHDGHDLDTLRIQKQHRPVRADRVVELPTDVAVVLDRALAPEVDDRYPSVSALATDLRRARNALPLAWRPQTVRYRVGLWARRNRRILRQSALAALVVVALVSLGFVAKTVEERQVEADAERRRLLVERRLERAAAEGDWETVAAGVEDFASDPAHRGTAAVPRVWRSQAERLERAGRPEALDAYTTAYTLATTTEDVRAVKQALARRFDLTSDWIAAARLHRTLDPVLKEALRAERFRTAVALRRFDEAAQLDPTHGSMLAWLGRAEKLPASGDAARWVSIGGTRWLATMDTTLVLSGPTPPVDLGFGQVLPQAFTAREGTTWLAVGDGRRPGTLYALNLRDGRPVATARTALPAGRVARLRAVPGDDRLLLATTYPDRGLWWVDPASDTVVPAHPATHATRSDAMALEVFDVDGDGQDEVVAAFGAWNAHDLRIFDLRDGTLVLRTRRRVGTVADVAPLPGRGFQAGKADLEANPSIFPGQGFGPPAGLYLLGPDLTERGFLPPPLYDHPDSGPEKSFVRPLVADFDGDGRLDVAWSAELFDVAASIRLWIVSDVLGDARSLVVDGVAGFDVHTRDGRAELLVGLPDGSLWILGRGDQALPTLDAPATARPSPPTGLDPVVDRGWRRAEELADLGLVAQAARGMAALVPLAGGRDAAAIHGRAGLHFATTMAYDDAAHHLEQALQAADDPQIRAALVRTDVDRLELEAARSRVRDTPAWLADAPDLSSTPLFPDDRWRLVRPHVFRRAADRTLSLRPFNDEGLLATLPVRVEGPVVAVDMEVTIQDVELGAGLAVHLVGPAGVELLVDVWGQGGGGTLKAFQNCGSDLPRAVSAPHLHAPAHLRLRAARIGPLATLRCHTDLDGNGRWVSYPAAPLPPGDYTLEIRVAGDADYGPPTELHATDLVIHGIGLTPRAGVSDDPHRSLLDGAIDPGLSPLDQALIDGDATVVTAALVPHLDDTALLRRLLRRHDRVVTAPLVRLLGPRFPAVFRDTWDEAVRYAGDRPDIDEAVLRPELAALPPSDPAGAEVRLWRARVLVRRGERAAASSLLTSVRDADLSPRLLALLEGVEATLRAKPGVGR